MHSHHKDGVNFDSNRHNLNIERRIMERGDVFNIDTKNNNSSKYFKEQNNLEQNNFGEITGRSYQSVEIDQGMPMRDFLSDTNQKNTETLQNPFVDFNLYSSDSQQNINYNDTSSHESFGNLQTENANTYSNEIAPTQYINPITIVSTVINSFGSYIFKAIETNFKHSRIVISPVNLILPFMVIYLGSSGDTTKYLKDIFSFPDKSTLLKVMSEVKRYIKDHNYIMDNNTLLLPSDTPSNKAFSHHVDRLCTLDHYNKNNNINETIRLNNNIYKSSHRVIKDVLSTNTINNKSSIISINTIIMKTKWKQPFSKSKTRIEQFYGINKKNVEMMTMGKCNHKFSEDEHNYVLEMDMINDYSMAFVVSKNSEVNLTFEQINYYNNNMRNVTFDVVKIPKFKYQCRYRIDNIMKKIGINDLFDNINLDNMCTSNVNISEVIHHVVISVDEGGDGNEPHSDVNSSSNEFIINRPFSYYVTHKLTNNVILIGSYN